MYCSFRARYLEVQLIRKDAIFFTLLRRITAISMSTTRDELNALLSSAILVFAGTVVQSTSKLFERTVLGRMLSPAVYGDVSIALSVMSFAVIFSKSGLSQGVPRFMARFEESADIRGAWATGLLTVGLVSAVVVGVLGLNISFLASALFDSSADSQTLLALVLLAVPFVGGMHIGVSAVRGAEKTLYKTLVRDLLFPVVRVGLLIGLLFLGYGAVSAGYAYLAGAACGFFVIHYCLNKLVPLRGPVSLHSREMLVFSLPLMISTSLAILLTKADTLMVGYIDSSYAAGLYAAAFPLANGLVLVLRSFAFLYLPLASRLDTNGRRDELDSIYKLTSKWIFIATFPLFLTFVSFPADVLRIFFGPEYTQAALALVILSVGFFTNAAGGRNRETLSALGYSNYILGTNLLAFGCNVALNLWLIPLYGFVGAAVASASSYILLNAVACGILIVAFDISPLSKWTVRTFLLLPGILIPTAVLLSRYLSLTAGLLPVVGVAFGALTIAVVAVTGCLQRDDLILIEAVESRLGVHVPFVRRFFPG